MRIWLGGPVMRKGLSAILLISGLIGVPLQLPALPPDLSLVRVFDERAEFRTVAIPAADSMNGVLLAGTATEGQYQFYLVHVDSAGNPVSNDLYGLADQLFCMTWDSDGGLTMAGNTSVTGEYNYRMIRLNADGQMEGAYEFGSDFANETIRAIRAGSGNRYYLAADVDSGQAQFADARLLRVEANGQDEWTINLPMGWRSAALDYYQETLFLYGTTDSVTWSGDRDYFEMSADTAGVADIYRAFGGRRMDRLSAATRLLSGRRIMVGTSNSFSQDSTRTVIWILATDANGDSLWSRFWRAAGSAVATGVSPTRDLDSGFVVTGYVTGPDSGRVRGILAKYRGNGDSLWTFTYPDSANQRFNAVAQDSRSRYHIAGMSRVGAEDRGLYIATEPDPSAPGQQPPQQFSLLAPTDQAVISSDTVFFDWENAIDPDGDAVRYALLFDTDTLFQQPIAFGPLNFSHYIWRNDSDDIGFYWRVVAQDVFNNTRICDDRQRFLYRVIPDSTALFSLIAPDSGIALPQPWAVFSWQRAADPDLMDTVSYSLHFLTDDTTLHLTALSDTFVTMSFANNPVFDEAMEVEWYVTAESLIPEMQRDSRQRWTFVTWSAEAEDRATVARNFGILSAAPNPFNQTSRIEFSLDRSEPATLEVYDVAGRLVITLLDSELLPGQHRVAWDAAGASSGVYFARLAAGHRVHTVKLLLLR